MMNWVSFLYDKEIYSQPKTTVVLLKKNWADLTEDEVTLLNKILGAVKVNPAGAVFIKTLEIDYSLLNNYRARKTLAFGFLSPEKEAHGFIAHSNNKIVFSPELNALNDNEKKILWGNLKKAFS
ncbi:MAG: hypothetical protein O9302_09965 [Cyclobacteriaceae bacterium]|jgi:hypothetical protein|nr:hypothetical protein [Cytophagales bacterium]MCZ8328373.1 hypothetical protein [Cyclobacteriaceae bacterium]